MSRRLNEDFYLQQQQQQQCSSEAQTVKTFSEKIITKTYKKALYPGGKGEDVLVLFFTKNFES